MKTNSLAAKILKGIALGGLVILAASSPYFGINLLSGFKKKSSKKDWWKFYRSLKYLNRRGYVKLAVTADGKISVKIARAGEIILKKVDIDLLKIVEPKTWDGKWRLVIFDVPVSKSRSRMALTEKLKDLGFIMVQKSVWAYPYECRDEISILRKFYEIERCVSYLEVVTVEDELDWRGKFNLKNH